jgi:glycosyltransferase involved in cell wall biosynthesis
MPEQISGFMITQRKYLKNFLKGLLKKGIDGGGIGLENLTSELLKNTELIWFDDSFCSMSFERQNQLFESLAKTIDLKTVVIFLIPDKYFGAELIDFNSAQQETGLRYFREFEDLLRKHFLGVFQINTKIRTDFFDGGNFHNLGHGLVLKPQNRVDKELILGVVSKDKKTLNDFLLSQGLKEEPVFSLKYYYVKIRHFVLKWPKSVSRRIYLSFIHRLENRIRILNNELFSRFSARLSEQNSKLKKEIISGSLLLEATFRDDLFRLFDRFGISAKAKFFLSKTNLFSFSNCFEDLEKIFEFVDRLSFAASSVSSVRQKNATPCSQGILPQKEHILIISGMFPSIKHGGGLRVFDTILELNQKGYKVSLLCLEPLESELSCYLQLEKYLYDFCFFSPENFSADSCENWLKKQKTYYNVIHFEYPMTADWIPQLGRYGRFSVFTFMECVSRRLVMDLETLQIDGESEVLKLVSRTKDLIEAVYLESKAVQYADKLITLTPEDQDFVLKYFKGESVVVPTGVSRDLFRDKGISPNPGSVGFVGYYSHYPNIDALEWYFANVHSRVAKSVKNYKFQVYGKGDLSRFRQRYSGDPTVNFVGEFKDLHDVIQSQDVCVAPLVSGAGLRGKVMQYSALKRPTVTTSIGVSGLPYVHGEAMFVCDDPTEFAESIIKLLNDRNLRNSMAQKAFDITQRNYSWDQAIDMLETIYVGG